MIEFTADICGMQYVGGGWSLCSAASDSLVSDIGHFWHFFCLIDWLTGEHQAGDVRGRQHFVWERNIWCLAIVTS